MNDLDLKKITLKNGLTVLLKHQEGKSINIQITIKVGSVNEIDGERGFSHLIEHLLFEGTSKRPNAQLITSEIENLGGDLNAATSNESTHYYVKILNKHFKKGLDILSDMIMNSIFEEEIVFKEKKIVLEEIKMINDQPRYFQWLLFEKLLFKGTAYEKPVYGTIKDVNSANSCKAKEFFKKHYYPNNAILTIVGNYKHFEKELLDEIEINFGKWDKLLNDTDNNNNLKIIQNIPVNSKKYLEKNKDIQQIYLIQGVITPKITEFDSAVIEVIEAILGKPQSGRINNEIRTKRGLAYDVSVTYDNFLDFGFFAINVGTDLKNIDTVKSIINKEYLLEELTSEELLNAINYIEGKNILEMEDNNRLSELITFWEMSAKRDLTEEYLEKVKNVTLEDIKRVSKILFSNMTEIQLRPSLKKKDKN